jgi:hypothetical protein
VGLAWYLGWLDERAGLLCLVLSASSRYHPSWSQAVESLSLALLSTSGEQLLGSLGDWSSGSDTTRDWGRGLPSFLALAARSLLRRCLLFRKELDIIINDLLSTQGLVVRLSNWFSFLDFFLVASSKPALLSSCVETSLGTS